MMVLNVLFTYSYVPALSTEAASPCRETLLCLKHFWNLSNQLLLTPDVVDLVGEALDSPASASSSSSSQKLHKASWPSCRWCWYPARSSAVTDPQGQCKLYPQNGLIAGSYLPLCSLVKRHCCHRPYILFVLYVAKQRFIDPVMVANSFIASPFL